MKRFYVLYRSFIICLKWIILFTLVLFWSHPHLTAQYALGNYSNINYKDGLTYNIINEIVQDNNGFIWIGTKYGLSRFDGKRFLNFYTWTDKYTLPSNNIYHLEKLKSGNIGVSTDKGAVIIDPIQMKFMTIKIPVSDSLARWGNFIQHIYEDHSGRIGVSSKTGFFIFSPNGTLTAQYQYYTNDDIGKTWMLFGKKISLNNEGSFLQNNSHGFIEETNHRLSLQKTFGSVKPKYFDGKSDVYFVGDSIAFWVDVKNANLKFLDYKNNRSFNLPIPDTIKVNLDWFSKLTYYKNNLFLLNGINGFYELTLNTANFSWKMNHFVFLKELFIKSIFVSNDNKVWLATNSGLYYEKYSYFKSNVIDLKKYFNKSTLITSVLHIPDGFLVGTNNDGLWMVIVKDSQQLVAKKLGISNSKITQILQRDVENYWIGTNRGLFNLKLAERLISTIDINPGLKQNEILYLYKDNFHNIWIVPNLINTVYKYNLKEEKLVLFESNNEQKLQVNVVSYLVENVKENYIWLIGDGAVRYKIVENCFDSLCYSLNALKSIENFALLYDDEGKEFKLMEKNWTYGTLNSLDESIYLMPHFTYHRSKTLQHWLIYFNIYNKLIFKNVKSNEYYIYEEELPGLNTDLSIDKMNNSLNFGSGTSLYNVKIPNNHNEKPCMIYINNISSKGKDLVVNNNIDVNHDGFPIIFDLSLINFQNDLKDIYYSFDNVWKVCKDGKFQVDHLPSGNSFLKIGFLKRNGKIQIQKHVQVNVKPPFYESYLFYFICSVMILSTIGIVYRKKINKIRVQLELERKMSDLELKALQSQMNPHFVFNCLNSLKQMVVMKEYKEAAEYIDRFAIMMRDTLEQSKVQEINLYDMINYLKNFLAMEKIRLPYLNYEIQIDPEINLNDVTVMAMVIQPLLENAIKYGAGYNKNNPTVIVRFIEVSSKIYCEIEDFGLGIEAMKGGYNSMHKSEAIANVKERISIYNKKNAALNSIEIIDKSCLIPAGNGTLIKLSF